MATKTKKKKSVEKVAVEAGKGKNVRISEDMWNLLRSYCGHKGFVMGAFVENALRSKIPFSYVESLQEQ